MRRRTSGLQLVGWALLLALTVVLFHRTIEALFHRWWRDPTYSHGLLVPAVTLFFLWDRRDRFAGAGGTGSLWGAAALLAALALFFAGQLGNMLFVQAVALVAALAALVLLVEGKASLKVAAMPIVFLLFMCPLPSVLYDPVSAQLRLFASATSTVLLQILGVIVTRTGNIIHLANATLSVEDACSGIRSLFGITATATAFAFIMPGGAVRKTVLVVSAVPIAVFSNVLRVTGTGLLYQYAGSRFAEGFYHKFEGWVFYVIALAVLFAELFVLNKVFPPGEPSDGEKRTGAEDAK